MARYGSGMAQARVCVVGAGNVGCYVGGLLAAAGAHVTLIARPRVAEEVRSHGLTLSDFRGRRVRVRPDSLEVATEMEAAAGADVILVTVKSRATAEVARELARTGPRAELVLSLQNGLSNAQQLAQGLPGRSVLAGIVQFNVVAPGQGHFHQGSEGGLAVERSLRLEPFLEVFARAGLPLALHQDLKPVQWAKLLLNLNNAINALSNKPLKEELGERAYRRCLGAAQAEALALLDARGIAVARLTALPPRWLPRLLDVPDVLFARLGGKVLAIDPLARSSMWDDLERGHPTEVDAINGAVVQLARELGKDAPVNARLVALVHAAERGGRRDFTGPALLRAISGSTCDAQ